MRNNNYLRAKVLTLIPIVVLVVTVICMVLASILEVPTSRGVIYTIFAFVSLISMFIFPLPCLVLSILGTVFAAKAAKDGTAKTPIFFILGIIEILVYVVGVILAFLMIMAAQAV